MPKIPQRKRQIRPIGGAGIPGIDRSATAVGLKQLQITGETLLALGEKLDDARRNTLVAENLTASQMAFENRLEEYRQDPDFWSHPADAEKFAEEQVATVMGSARDKLAEDALGFRIARMADAFKLNAKRDNWDRQIIYSKTADVGVMENLLEGWPKANSIERKAMSDWLKEHLTRQTEAGIYHAWEADAKYQGFIHGAEALRAREDMIDDPESVFVGIQKGEYDLDEKRKVYLSDMASRRAEAMDAKEARFMEKQELDIEEATKEAREGMAGSLWDMQNDGILTDEVLDSVWSIRGIELSEYKALQKAIRAEGEQEDIDVINNLHDKIDQGVDVRQEINRAVEQGTIFKKETVSSLHSRNYSVLNQIDVYGTQPYKDAKQWVKDQQSVSGPGALLFKQGEPQRKANAMRYYDEKIEEGIAPWDAADETIRVFPAPIEVPLHMMRLPLYGPGKIETMEDVDEAKRLLATARHKKQIGAEKYNEEYLHIETLEAELKRLTDTKIRVEQSRERMERRRK